MESMTGFAQIFWVLLIIIAFIDIAIRAFSIIRKFLIRKHPASQVDIPDELPDGVEVFESDASPSKELSNYSATDKKSLSLFQIKDVRNGIKPYLLPFTDKEALEWNQILKDGFSGDIIVAGNLMFGADRNEKIITLFKHPVNLQFTYNLANSNHIKNLITERGEQLHQVWKSEMAKVAEIRKQNKLQKIFDDVPDPLEYVPVLIPVFLYSVKTDNGIFQVWKPFQSYEINTNINNIGVNTDPVTVSVEFKVWGDMQVGIGIIDAPKDFGHP